MMLIESLSVSENHSIRQPIAINVNQISKSYQNIQALKKVSFQVPTGTVFTILGSNGAGKTTLLKILMTITKADNGEVSIFGQNINKQPLQTRAKIGLVSQDNHFETYFSVWDNLRLHAELHGLSKSQYSPRIENLLKKVGLWERRHSNASQFSGGMQRKVALIRALIHQPQLLFLDEPTTGLDPMARRQIWELIETIKDQTTVVLTTHYMEEADILSDQIMILNHGQVVMQGTPKELKQSISPKNRFELQLKTPTASDYLEKFNQLSQTHSLTCDLTQHGDYKIQFCLPEGKSVMPWLALVAPEDFYQLGESESDLEDVFVAVANRLNSTLEDDTEGNKNV